MINTTNIIVPHGFIPTYQTGKEPTRFYDHNENALYTMAMNHYHGDKVTRSEFSSWAASLHLVFCYARDISASKTAYVAVMDTHNLDSEVLVWHVPHLIPRHNHEYLAHGVIKVRDTSLSRCVH
jgi:hypothetical protein